MLEEWSYDSPPTPNVLITKDDWDLCLMITSKLQRMMIDQDAPSRSITQTTHVTQSPVIPQGVDDDYHDCEVAYMNNDLSPCYISSWIVVPPNVHFVNQPQEHNGKCRLERQNG